MILDEGLHVGVRSDGRGIWKFSTEGNFKPGSVVFGHSWQGFESSHQKILCTVNGIEKTKIKKRGREWPNFWQNELTMRGGYFRSRQRVMAKVGIGCHRDLERRDVERRHVVLTAALVLVVDDVLADVVVGVRVLDLGLATPVVHDEHKHQDCRNNNVLLRLVKFWQSAQLVGEVLRLHSTTWCLPFECHLSKF